MFVPNQSCFMRQRLDTYDKYGKPAFGERTSMAFALVRFDTKTEDSTVRADSSATRGNIKEYVASGRVLVPTTIKPNWGDLLIIEKKVFRVKSVEPRYNVLGQLDHYQLDFEKAEDLFGDEV